MVPTPKLFLSLYKSWSQRFLPADSSEPNGHRDEKQQKKINLYVHKRPRIILVQCDWDIKNKILLHI